MLKNKRHETFANELARGRSATEAYTLAGYQPCRQNASRLASFDYIQHRVTELKEQHAIDVSNSRDSETGRFLSGNNLGGRPKGSRNRLGTEFIEDLHVEWQRSGAKALKRVAEDDPVAFVKVVANVLPREIDATLTIDTQLFQEVRDFREAFRLARAHIGADDVDIPLIELTSNNDGETVDG